MTPAEYIKDLNAKEKLFKRVVADIERHSWSDPQALTEKEIDMVELAVCSLLGILSKENP